MNTLIHAEQFQTVRCSSLVLLSGGVLSIAALFGGIIAVGVITRKETVSYKIQCLFYLLPLVGIQSVWGRIL